MRTLSSFLMTLAVLVGGLGLAVGATARGQTPPQPGPGQCPEFNLPCLYGSICYYGVDCTVSASGNCECADSNEALRWGCQCFGGKAGNR
jgi:hypothetical protein